MLMFFLNADFCAEILYANTVCSNNNNKIIGLGHTSTPKGLDVYNECQNYNFKHIIS